MTSFQGSKTAPPKPASAGLVALAALFDRVAVICYQHTCEGQVAAWPSSLQSKLTLIDSAQVNARLEIADVDDHGYRVTQGHAAAWELLKDPNTSSVLIFEDDWTASIAVDEFENADSIKGMQDFVDSGNWGMLRLGYNPLELAMPDCPKHCACSPPPETNLACAVTLGNISEPHCDVRRSTCQQIAIVLNSHLDRLRRSRSPSPIAPVVHLPQLMSSAAPLSSHIDVTLRAAFACSAPSSAEALLALPSCGTTRP